MFFYPIHDRLKLNEYKEISLLMGIGGLNPSLSASNIKRKALKGFPFFFILKL